MGNPVYEVRGQGIAKNKGHSRGISEGNVEKMVSSQEE